MKNRVIICSSLTQLINSMAAINSLNEGKNYITILIITNPFLSETEVSKIINFAKEQSFNTVINFTKLFKLYIKENEYSSKSSYYLIKRLIYKINNKIKKIYFLKRKFTEIKSKLNENNMLEIESLYTRGRTKIYESLLINSFQKINKLYCIEDGVGDYIHPNTIWSEFITYEIKFKIREFISKLLNFFISFLITLNFNQSLIFSSLKKVKFNKIFRNIKMENYEYKYLKSHDIINTQNEFKKIIKNFSNNFQFNYKVIIFDSLLNDQLKIEFNKVPVLYNSIINSILSNKQLNKEDIFFKHHPRLNYKYWKILKENIICDISDFNSNLSHLPGEFLLNNQSTQEVYSVGSTALFYSKFLFKKKSYFIIFDNKHFHPSAFKKYQYFFLKYKFDVFDATKMLKL